MRGAIAEPDRFQRCERSPPTFVARHAERFDAVSTFSCALSVGMRLNPWNTNPISFARMPASRPSGR